MLNYSFESVLLRDFGDLSEAVGKDIYHNRLIVSPICVAIILVHLKLEDVALWVVC